MSFQLFLDALGARHFSDLHFSEVTRALRALSSTYVERRTIALRAQKVGLLTTALFIPARFCVAWKSFAALRPFDGGTVFALDEHLDGLPLAAPALWTMAYRLHRRPVVGWVIAGGAVAMNVALFVASLVFLASGQSFEQFSGLE